jgi:hypothetical protein
MVNGPAHKSESACQRIWEALRQATAEKSSGFAAWYSQPFDNYAPKLLDGNLATTATAT